MMKQFVRILLVIVAINIIQSVMIDHENNDIRRGILSNFQDKPKKELFKVFHFLFQKKYDLNSQEGLQKYQTFKNNMKFIETQNNMQNSYKLGITEFTDLTADEFTKTYVRGFSDERNGGIQKFLNFQKESSSVDKTFNFDNLVEDEDEVLMNQNLSLTKIDWRSKLNPVTNQGSCGSCWAFSVIGAIEANYNIKFGNSPRFSQQQLVDCDDRNGGCEGGVEYYALDYIKQNGIAFDNDYPYTSGRTQRAQSCVASTKKMNNVVSGYEDCPRSNCSKEKIRTLLAKGPLMVGIDGDGRMSPTEATSIFQHYTEGVLTSPCKVDNHAVLLVGVDSDDNGEYVIGSNSWGSSWGENGNFRFRSRASDKTCFMESTGILPIVKQSTNPEPSPPEPECLKLYSDCDFNGKAKEICSNTPAIENFDKISGFSLGKFSSARLYVNPNCRGGYLPVDDSITCLAETNAAKLQDKIKSVLVDNPIPPSGCVWLHDENCLAGNKIEICENVSDLNDAKYNFGNKISSLNLGRGVKSVTVYLDKDYKGNSATLKNTVYGMHGSWVNKDIESIKINLV